MDCEHCKKFVFRFNVAVQVLGLEFCSKTCARRYFPAKCPMGLHFIEWSPKLEHGSGWARPYRLKLEL